MRRRAAPLWLAGLLLAGSARAQQDPDQEWGAFPQLAPPAPPAVEDAPLPPPPPPPTLWGPPAPAPALPAAPRPVALRLRPEVAARVRAPEFQNRVSLLGPTPLGHLRRGGYVALGFPLVSLRALLGLGERVDVGLGFDTAYGMLNEGRLVGRVGLAQGAHWRLGVALEAGYALFSTRASREVQGARWLTGRRNVNVSPALLLSYQGDGGRAARVIFEVAYLLALDTEPFATDPLGGVPPPVVPGHNLRLGGGVELPLTATTALSVSGGLELRGRANDAAFMPTVAVGFLTAL